MGNCSSCLVSPRRDVYEEEEESRLLFDDALNMQYGSFGEQQMNGHEDPLEVQREMEALQRVVARTSDNMVDVFEIAPQGKGGYLSDRGVNNFPNKAHESRQARYHALLSRLMASDTAGAVSAVDWTHRGDVEGETTQMPQLNGESDAPLVGNFADAAAAMR